MKRIGTSVLNPSLIKGSYYRMINFFGVEQIELRRLFGRYLEGALTPAEYEQLSEAAQSHEAKDWEEALTPLIENTTTTETFDEQEWKSVIEFIVRQPTIKSGKTISMNAWFRRVAAAAVIILMLCVGGYFILRNDGSKRIAATETQQQRFKNDVAPGGNKAILTLADGSQIVLDSATNGTLTQQGNTKIIKLNSGQLAYNAATATGKILYNNISTPKGGQYQIILADGSKVWLNAASSLRFPTSFSKERNVELTGEGYFEVAHNASKPFHVSVKGMNIEVLGTHFNVNGYDDENSIRTTLLEGSVKTASTVLKPGQQARVGNNPSSSSGQVISVVTADIDEVMAWKEGRFHFEGADIKTIMRQLSRWYDVEVNYEGNISDFFVAEIARDVPVSKLLQLLELTNLVHFKIEGNKITVMK